MHTGYAIAAGHALTARTAAAVLAEGGTAMDAALAGALMAMVAEPVLAGLLGGGFAMIRRADGHAHLLDAFVQTPRAGRPESETDLRAVEADFGTARQTFHIGAGTIAASGLAAGLVEGHARFGRMPLRELVAPAAAAAREGVIVTAWQAQLAQIIAPILTASAGARALHCDRDGLRRQGALARNPDFAAVLEELAAEGPRFVQEGEIAAGLIALCAEGGHLTRDDLARYRPVWRTPLRIARGQARIALNPAPSLGGTLIGFALSLLDRAPVPADIARAFALTVRARLEAEAGEGLDTLLSPEAAASYRKRLLGRPAATRGTTHLSVIDRTGMGVALTLSNGEGCGLVLPGTGIMPNNMLGELDLVPQGGVSWPRDERLASMMAPMAVDWPDGRLAMLGSGGSNRIRTALTQVLLHLIDREAGVEAAIEAPRLHVEGHAPARLDYEESGLAAADRAALLADWPEACGWDAPSMFFGGVHATMRDARGGTGAAGDPRRDGHALVA